VSLKILPPEHYGDWYLNRGINKIYCMTSASGRTLHRMLHVFCCFDKHCNCLLRVWGFEIVILNPAVGSKTDETLWLDEKENPIGSDLSGTPAVLTGGVSWFSSGQSNARIVNGLGQDRLLTNPFQFIVNRSSVILPFDVAWSSYWNVQKQDLKSSTFRKNMSPPWRISFTLDFCLAYSSIQKMEAISSSETSVDFQRTTRRYIPEDRILHNHRCENFKSYILKDVSTSVLWIGSIVVLPAWALIVGSGHRPLSLAVVLLAATYFMERSTLLLSSVSSLW
jgi:hypothetical protein